MTNEQLKAFIAVAETGSFRAAAVRVCKTQSTVSAAVKGLEQEFGFQLFSRDSYRPALTSEGRAFYQQSVKVLEGVDQLAQLGHQLAQPETGTLSIAMGGMCALPSLLERLQRFIKDYAQLSFTMTTEHMSGLLEQLETEHADLAIGPEVGLDEHYEFIEIAEITQICVATPEFIDGRVGIQLSQQEMRERVHVLVSDSGRANPFSHVNVIPGGLHWYVDDQLVKKSMISAGLAWGRIPAHLIETELSAGSLVQLNIADFANRSKVPIYLIRHREKPHSSIARRLWQQFAA